MYIHQLTFRSLGRISIKKSHILMKNFQIIFNFLGIALIFSAVGCGGLQPISDSGGYRPSNRGEDQLRLDIVEYAMTFKGTKYKYAGMSPRGFDCSGFTSYVMDNFGIELTHQSGVQETEGTPVSESKARPGDLVFFRKSRTGKVFHVAMVVSNGPDGIEVIHATSSRGVVVDNIQQSSYWSAKHATIRNVID
jgi:hypothetical protein